MSSRTIFAALDALGHQEKLQGVSRLFGFPHMPEYELESFRDLYFPELSRWLEDSAEEPGAQGLLLRGRLRRLLGDAAGAACDLRAALDLEPKLAPAHAWLGEIDLRRPESRASLTRAIELDSRLSCAYLYRGAASLLSDDRAGAERDLQRFVELRPQTALGRILAGTAAQRRGASARAKGLFLEAVRRDPVCSAARLLCSRLSSGRERVRHFHEAYNASAVLGFITLQIHRAVDVEAPSYVEKILDFAFSRPEEVGAYYRREVTQSHFSHFPAEDYDLVSALAARYPRLPWVQAFFGRAACYTPAGVAEGVRHLSRAVAGAPHCGWIYAWRANARRASGDSAGALKDFNAAVRLQPFYHRTFVWRGGLYRKFGRREEARADLDRAVAMDPYYSLTYYERSMTRRALGDMAGAATDLDRAFLLDHRYSWVYKMGSEPSAAEFAAGLAQLDAAVAAHSGGGSALVWRGQLKAQKGDLSGALLDLGRAIELDPYHALAHAWLGRALERSGQPERARAPLERALELEPQLWIAQGWLAEAERGVGLTGAALARLSEVLRRKPKTPWAHRLRAEILFGRGRARAAEAALAKALEIDGKYPEAYLLLAQVRLARRDVAGAYAAIGRCLEIAPNMGRAYVVRAEIHQRAVRPAEVLADYRAVLKDFPYLLNAEQRARVEDLLAKAGSGAERTRKEEELAVVR